MSEASLKIIEAETCAEIANVKTSDDGTALLMRFHTRIARDAVSGGGDPILDGVVRLD